MINVAIKSEDGQPVDLNPLRQADWRDIVEQSCFTPTSLMAEYDIKESTFFGWLALRSRASEKSMEKMVKIMSKLLTPPCRRIEKHPSYGYATPEQIKRLGEIGLGQEHEQIMRAIAKQNDSRGKIK